MSLSYGRRLDGGGELKADSPKIKSEMQEMCGTCDELRKVKQLLSSKCQIFERQIESLGKTNAESGSLLQESEQKLQKLNQVVALLTQQIAEKITENSMLRVESDMNKGGKVKENNCQLDGNDLEFEMQIPSEVDNLQEKETNKVQGVENYSEMENSENSDDVQVIEEAEDRGKEVTMDKEQLQTCAWIVSDGKGTSGACGRVFPAVRDLVAHVNKDHFRTGINICMWDGCKRNGEPFKSRTIIDNHFRTHSGEKPFRCTFEGCDRAFADRGTLSQHRHSHLKTKYPCLDPECPKVFSQKPPMMTHYRVRHTGEKKGFPCPVEGCGKVFETDQVMRKHRVTHRAERPYRCKFHRCSMSFASKQSLDEHSERHVPGAKHKCPFDGCGRKFAAARYVREHVNITHTGETPFACPHGCGMSFARAGTLKRHLNVHNTDTAEPPETKVVGTG